MSRNLAVERKSLPMADLKVIRRWPGIRSKPWVESFIARVGEEKSISVVVAIGSSVRQRGHRRSDLDLLVLYEGVKPKLRAPIEVDIRYYPLGEVGSLIQKGNEIIGWAVRFGVVLYDPRRDWERLHKKWNDVLPLPSLEEARKRAVRAFKAAQSLVKAGDESAAADLILASITQVARARLLERGVYPASRPELPSQLRDIGEPVLAELLDDALDKDVSASELIERLGRLSALD